MPSLIRNYIVYEKEVCCEKLRIYIYIVTVRCTLLQAGKNYTKPPEQTLDMSLYNLETRSYKNNLIHIIKLSNNSMIKASEVFKPGLVNLKSKVYMLFMYTLLFSVCSSCIPCSSESACTIFGLGKI